MANWKMIDVFTGVLILGTIVFSFASGWKASSVVNKYAYLTESECLCECECHCAWVDVYYGDTVKGGYFEDGMRIPMDEDPDREREPW